MKKQEIDNEIEAIEESLGDKKEIIDNFFKEKESYSNDDLVKLGITEKELRDYADLGLGIQIRDCVLENGDCNFEAEL